MNPAYNMLGLCLRAGKLVSGAQAVGDALKRGKACLVLIDADASEATKKALFNSCRSHNVAVEEIESQALGMAIGKPERMTAAVTDSGFAARIQKLLKNGG